MALSTAVPRPIVVLMMVAGTARSASIGFGVRTEALDATEAVIAD